MGAHPRLCRAQVRALWDGLTSGTGRMNVALEDLWQCQKAGEQGDDALAEFADMYVGTFKRLSQPKLSKDKATTNIQAVIRSLVAQSLIVRENVDTGEDSMISAPLASIDEIVPNLVENGRGSATLVPQAPAQTETRYSME